MVLSLQNNAKWNWKINSDSTSLLKEDELLTKSLRWERFQDSAPEDQQNAQFIWRTVLSSPYEEVYHIDKFITLSYRTNTVEIDGKHFIYEHYIFKYISRELWIPNLVLIIFHSIGIQ